MKTKILGLCFGTAFGFILAWAKLADAAVIRDMLLLREPDVFLLMGSTVVVAAIGVRILRAIGARTLATNEPITWQVERPGARHVLGSILFGAGWGVAGTCPGPVAAMIGEGRLGGLAAAAGLAAGVALQGGLARRWMRAPVSAETVGAVGL